MPNDTEVVIIESQDDRAKQQEALLRTRGERFFLRAYNRDEAIPLLEEDKTRRGCVAGNILTNAKALQMLGA